jgi:hypothetical protein
MLRLPVMKKRKRKVQSFEKDMHMMRCRPRDIRLRLRLVYFNTNAILFHHLSFLIKAITFFFLIE